MEYDTETGEYSLDTFEVTVEVKPLDYDPSEFCVVVIAAGSITIFSEFKTKKDALKFAKRFKLKLKVKK